jgi:hypothetical protein
MRKSMIIAGLMAALILGVSATAQDEKPAGQAAMDMGAPAQMKQVAFMVGIWDVSMQYRMSPEAKWTEATAINTNNFILDGCVLESEFEGDMDGMPMHGISMTTYNRGLGQWQTMWTDTGGFTDGKIVCGGTDVMPDGTKVRARVTSYNIADTSYDWMMEMSMDDGQTWYTSMKAKYTKRQ